MDNLQGDVRNQPEPLRAYTPPRLYHYGDIRRMTLGGSPAGGDTQNGAITRPIAFYGDFHEIP